MYFDGNTDFWNSARKIYWVQNATATDTDLINGGLYRNNDFLTYLTVPKAGHFVPNNYYSVTQQFLQDYISDKKLKCHEDLTKNKSCIVTSKMQTAMNNCNDNGLIEGGFCVCDEGFKFADCSKEVKLLTTCTNDSPCNLDRVDSDVGGGPVWYTLAYNGTASDSTLKITPNVTTDIYVSKDATSDPNNFVYDIAFKGIVNQTVTIGAKALGLAEDESGFSVALFVNGLDEGKNDLLDSRVTVSFESGSIAHTIAIFSILTLTQLALTF